MLMVLYRCNVSMNEAIVVLALATVTMLIMIRKNAKACGVSLVEGRETQNYSFHTAEELWQRFVNTYCLPITHFFPSRRQVYGRATGSSQSSNVFPSNHPHCIPLCTVPAGPIVWYRYSLEVI